MNSTEKEPAVISVLAALAGARGEAMGQSSDYWHTRIYNRVGGVITREGMQEMVRAVAANNDGSMVSARGWLMNEIWKMLYGD